MARSDRTRIHGYVENVVSRYSQEEFKRMFRLSRPTFESILNLLNQCPELYVHGHGGREAIPPEKQLLVTLWYLGGTESIIKIADRFGISESSVVLSRKRVFSALLNNFKNRLISWPKNENIDAVIDRFQTRNGFNGIVGALDATHIQIKAPKDDPQSYVNRKKYHSLILQSVCDDDMKFLHCFAGFPGSCHDARVLRNSSLWNNGMSIHQDYHVVADGAYPLREWLMTPYRDNGHLSERQRNFNNKLSANRVVIERAFGLLKGRFRRLNFIDAEVKTAVQIIMCAAILHNICIIQRENIDYIELNEDEIMGEIHNNDDNEAVGVLKRDLISRRLAIG